MLGIWRCVYSEYTELFSMESSKVCKKRVILVLINVKSEKKGCLHFWFGHLRTQQLCPWLSVVVI